MQYVGRALGSVSKTWSSINPATLSGAIDVIVVEHPDGRLSCSPFHVRFGKFQILKPSQKKVQVFINEKLSNMPMKLSDSGEAYFVFEMGDQVTDVPDELLVSPVMSATSSPPQSPETSILEGGTEGEGEGENENKKKEKKVLEEPDFLDINDTGDSGSKNSETTGSLSPTESSTTTPLDSVEERKLVEQRTKNFQQKLNKKLTEIHIPSKLDNNGDLLLDTEGYKPNKNMMHDTDIQLKQLLKDEFGNDSDISSFIKEDKNGNIKIVNPYEHLTDLSPPGTPPTMATSGSVLGLDAMESGSTLNSLSSSPSGSDTEDETSFSKEQSSKSEKTSKKGTAGSGETEKRYIRTIRLTNDQLKCLNLTYGENDLKFSVDHGKAIVTSKLFVWRWDVPIVISDIDGTITKSDALGHVLAMIGKDWTHLGVAKLFSEISRNGYNILYLTARSAGQADSTRSYLRSIEQNGSKLPNGPVILSPDRTMAALRREVILKKPEVFKIACLNDIRSLYFEDSDNEMDTEEKSTPFFAGFGNRITDALSYRTVGIPSSRIFTINTEGEVHMELLELAGYRSSYIHINELVDHFFPPVSLDSVDLRTNTSMVPGSPPNRTLDNFDSEITLGRKTLFRGNQEEKFTDVNFWRDPLVDIDNLSDISNDDSDNIDEDTDVSQQSNVSRNRANSVKTAKVTKAPQRNVSGSTNNNEVLAASSDVENASDLVGSHSSSGSTPNKSTMSKGDIGKQIYLELGSPLASPKLRYLDDMDDEDSNYNRTKSRRASSAAATSIDKEFKKLSVSKAGAPTRIVSKIDVSNDVHSLGNSDTESRREQSVNETGRNQLPHNSMDDKDLDSRVSDEFDDDEFDEDEFED
ncbi:BPK_HP2_G0040110.mRNA.1.CDS.1 [Saccharomyces cerevisiae]|uniref:Pah1p n=2 Tax=Saccharomyces cerevisiae TaxID=4932 RepID=C8ZF25_YEAS8|nr:Pah1p [Saccharomyces cerevisiae YJM189]AJS63774.1 Pah1p [Saccharomyces cerevisiae YJM248]AJS64647.1 Pah1p [Saccharomyces cerevisiae YJM271]AJS67266.1 Pah1p [Saccharomyces cerevisiae YJM453]AJS83420.1 Pah1p [Saccharomyces cerevisiae YJM1326]AJS83856.1 Pah1p [Saccharomyces cerevisiae YJM1332]AJS85158.1 Pah1p [Saccharomyces cerevisiae YJM1341]AJS88647.1 Pah1p [Saccharomyces cerevisiae YJM1387]AJS91709.1 Pah1p [Saccharomyces cerevisiae YJM1415]AJS95194.1 Pah1p [Saccharomyces cerevisiae YJM1